MSRKDHRRSYGQPRQQAPASPAVVEPPRNRSDGPSRQRFMVRVENMRAQTLVVSILDESGAVQGVTLTPRGKSHPIEHDRIGTYTLGLERQGHVRIVPES